MQGGVRIQVPSSQSFYTKLSLFAQDDEAMRETGRNPQLTLVFRR
jgi:hypothetical protein